MVETRQFVYPDDSVYLNLSAYHRYLVQWLAQQIEYCTILVRNIITLFSVTLGSILLLRNYKNQISDVGTKEMSTN